MDRAVLDGGPGCSVPVEEVRWRFSPSSGPGGQHANRAHTRVEASLDLMGASGIDDEVRRRLVERFGDELRVIVDEQRSQLRNRSIALDRLEERLRQGVARRRRRRPTRPTRTSVARRLADKRRRAERKRQRRPPAQE